MFCNNVERLVERVWMFGSKNVQANVVNLSIEALQ